MKREVIAYVTRDAGAGKREILVFRQPDFPEAGLQVPGGTVEAGEDLETAVLREAREETGLANLRVVARLGDATREWLGEEHQRTFFHLAHEGDTRARWHHVEQRPSNGEPPPSTAPRDPPPIFELFWTPLVEAVPGLAYGQDRFLDALLKPAAAVPDAPAPVRVVLPPRITLVDRKAPLLCPFCRDTLDASPVRCERCRTSYHAECARIASRCGLMGCEGAFGEAPESPRVAVVLRPTDEATDEQIELLAGLMSVGNYDVLLRLRTGVPLVVGWVEDALALRELTALAVAGLGAFGVPAAELARSDGAIVQRIDDWHQTSSSPAALVLRTVDGERQLDLGAPRTVVTGRYSSLTEESDLQRLETARPPKRTMKRESETARFIHVYDRAGALLSFEENVLADYRFLGDRKTPSAGTNFLRLLDILCAGATVDRRLDGVRGTIATRTSSRDRKNVFTSTNRPWMDSASRLVFHAAQAL